MCIKENIPKDYICPRSNLPLGYQYTQERCVPHAMLIERMHLWDALYPVRILTGRFGVSACQFWHERLFAASRSPQCCAAGERA